MTNPDYKKIKFPREENANFIRELRKKVNQYFEDNSITKYGNTAMVIKTVFMLSSYLVPYGLMISGVVKGFPALVLLWSLMGLGMAGIGLSIMHDANPMAYSKNTRVNRVLGIY